MTIPVQRKPDWLKVRVPQGENYMELKRIMRGLGLNTVCEEALCPNIGECWNHRTATFLILGDICTRACGFCNITTGRPVGLDWAEPLRVARAVQAMGLRHAVITSVNRDDLEDGGAAVFAATVRAIRRLVPGCSVEVLIPDFQGSWEALKVVMEAGPDILNHNVETVPRLYRRVRPRAVYSRSLELLRRAKDMAPGGVTKSGIMVGLGETVDEILETMRDIRAASVDILTIGQYLRPSKNNLPVERYYSPEEFRFFREQGMRMGFCHVESGPLVRSSYHAREQFDSLGTEGHRA